MVEPGSVHFSVSANKTLLDSLVSVGYKIESPCGGQGLCQKCIVKLLSGKLEPFYPEEKENLSFLEVPAEFQSCRYKPASDLVLSLREISQNPIKSSAELIDFRQPAQSYKAITILTSKKTSGKSISENVFADFKDLTEIPLSLLDKTAELVKDKAEKITFGVFDNRVLACEKGQKKPFLYGLALDLGTTNLEASLIDLTNGKELSRVLLANPQNRWGYDILSRISAAERSFRTKKTLQKILLAAIQEMVNFIIQDQRKIKRKSILELVFVGNSAMTHFLLGLPVSSLGQDPFLPVTRLDQNFYPADLKLNHFFSNYARCYFPALIGGFVGSDALAFTLASEVWKAEKPSLLIDLGTNSEIILGSAEQLWACSAAAGPAFEGKSISCGTSALPGAIDKVWWDSTFRFSTIENAEPVGICGSGLIDLMAILLELGEIDSSGKRIYSVFDKNSLNILLTDKISISQKDIRELQLAKAAIATGIEILLKVSKISLSKIEKILIAGSFGSSLRGKSLAKIGLIPQNLANKIEIVGNAALAGAQLMLMDPNLRKTSAKIAAFCQHIDLSSEDNFNEIFVKNLEFKPLVLK